MRYPVAVAVAITAVALACQGDHHVNILFGPNETQLSQGFACYAEDNSLMLAHSYVDETPGPGLTGSLYFNIVIDFIALGDGVPSCRGEDILDWCGSHTCAPVVTADRFCEPVAIHDIVPSQLLTQAQLDEFRRTALPLVYQQLGAHDITADAPDVPVIVRGVATLESCDHLKTVRADGTYPPFENQVNSPTLLGCAYSCPVVLDDVDGNIELSLDTGNVLKCEPSVDLCAGTLSQ